MGAEGTRQKGHTGRDLRINLNARVLRNPVLGKLDPLMYRYTTLSLDLGLEGEAGVALPLLDNGVVLHAIEWMISILRVTAAHDVKASVTYLLMLSILSIFLIPSQCRISGIRAWKRMSFTPAMFSVRRK